MQESVTRFPMFRFIATAAMLLAGGVAQGGVSARILLGVGDAAETNWDGDVIARGALVAAVEPWRFDGGDSMLPGNRWKMSTHPVRVFSAFGRCCSGAAPGGSQRCGGAAFRRDRRQRSGSAHAPREFHISPKRNTLRNAKNLPSG